MDDHIYFFDSYAIIKILKGSPFYEPYENATIIITKLNLFEVYYSLLRENGMEMAKKFLENYSQYVMDFDTDVIEEACAFHLFHKKRNISMTDSIGYSFAKKLGIEFLTGDKEFNAFENVVFVK